MRMLCASSVIALAFAASACGGTDNDPGDPFDTEIVGEGSGGPEFQPGGPAAAYPAGPYGTSIGSVAPNYELFGWTNPVAAGFDHAQLQKLSLADFYDPDGSKGTKVVLLSMAALWCGPCQAEYGGGVFEGGFQVRPFREHLAERYDAGFRLFGTVSQDVQAEPADLSDLTVWGERYNVEFPLAVDPAEKVGALRDADGVWPSAFIITTHDMRIQSKVSGADVWEAVDRHLE